MINSKLILDIFDLIFDDHKGGELLKKQIDYLTVSNTEHTGVGLFISFTADPVIQDYVVKQEILLGAIDSKKELTMIDGIEIKNDTSSILADIIVHIKEGIIDHLEIWNKNGEDYPKKEPDHYEMTQTWRNLADRRVINR